MYTCVYWDCGAHRVGIGGYSIWFALTAMLTEDIHALGGKQGVSVTRC